MFGKLDDLVYNYEIMIMAETPQTIQCFDIVRTVLEELYPFIPGSSDNEKDAIIREKLASLGNSYRQLRSGNDVDHSNLVSRFAYIFRYVTSHANIVFQLINESEDLKSVFEKDVLNVTCIGGCPGSDVLGILKYLLLENKTIHLNCNLFDKEKGWNECWSDIGSKVPQNLRFNTNYETIDITNQNDWSNKFKYLSSDLFTMTFFMSEVYCIKDSAEAFFQNLFSKAKKGSIFLFIDNRTACFYEWFDSFLTNNNFEILVSNEKQVSLYDADKKEEMKLLGVFWDKFNVDQARPKKNSNIAYRIVRKL